MPGPASRCDRLGAKFDTLSCLTVTSWSHSGTVSLWRDPCWWRQENDIGKGRPMGPAGGESLQTGSGHVTRGFQNKNGMQLVSFATGSEVENRKSYSPTVHGNRWCALLCGRRPMELVIQLLHPYHMTGVQSESIPLEKVVSVEIVSGPFWLRWLGVEKLALTVQRAERQVFSSAFIARRLVVRELRKSIVAAIEAALTDERIRIDDALTKFDDERKALFDASRYVRYSGEEKQVATHADLNSPSFRDRFKAWRGHLCLVPASVNEALRRRFDAVSQFFKRPHDAREKCNDEFVLRESKAQAEYFSRIEATRLTEEQVDASLRFDDANVTVAAAGWRKRSVMVSKVRYWLTEVARSRTPFCGFVGEESGFPGLPLPVEAAAMA